MKKPVTAYVFHDGDPQANAAVTLTVEETREVLEQCSLSFDARGGRFGATEFLSLTSGLKVHRTEPGSDRWTKLSDLSDLAMNAVGEVIYTPQK